MTKCSILYEEFIYCQCGCGKTRSKYNKRKQLARFIKNHNNYSNHQKQFALLQKGSNHSQWKGGRKNTNGYIYIWKPDHHFANCRGYVMEHRLVWEQFNKASLLPWGDVHHLNHNRSDNRIVNLQAMMLDDHGKLHGRPK